MASANILRESDTRIVLSGELTFKTILNARKLLESELGNSADNQIINFANVSLADSSSLSLWLCIQRKAKQLGIDVTAEALPEDIQSLCHMTGLSSDW